MTRIYRKQHQSGAALAVSLIILLVLTLVVMSSNRTVVLQERMTAAVRDGQVALAVAEAGARKAEIYIDSLVNKDDFNSSGTNGYYSEGNGPGNFFAAGVWSSGKYQTADAVDGVVAQYLIVDMGSLPVPEEDLTGINMMGYGQTTGGGDVNAFQIVSRATGKGGNAERVVVTYYGKRL